MNGPYLCSNLYLKILSKLDVLYILKLTLLCYTQYKTGLEDRYNNFRMIYLELGYLI